MNKITTLALNNGCKMPQVGFGCWKVPNASCADVIYQAIKAGVRLLDCASDYGNEKEVGDGIRKAISESIVKREELFVVSKLWNTYHDPKNVPAALAKTLSDLGLEYVDAYLIHFPIALKFVPFDVRYPAGWFADPDDKAGPRMEFEKGFNYFDTYRAMEGLQESGLARSIGCCNIGTCMLRQLLNSCRVPPAILQVEMHPELAQSKLLRFCRENGIATMAFSSFGASSYVELNMAQPGEQLLLNESVQKIGEAHGKTAAQVLLRWSVQRGCVVIPKTSAPERLVENMDVCDWQLTAEAMEVLDAMDKNKRYNDPGHFCEKAFNTFCPIYE